MTDSNTPRRIALLVDAENMHPQYMRQVLPHVFKLGRPIIQYAYGDFSNPCSKHWVSFLRRNVIEARQVTPAESGKNSADIALVVDAMALALDGRCDTLCVVSSDRDFVALTTHMKGRGIDVYGFGKVTTDKKYRQSCAKFFELKEQHAIAEKKAKQVAQQPEVTTGLKEAPLSSPTGAQNWPAVTQQIIALAGKGGWVTLQRLGCELGKLGIAAKNNGGANWAKVFSTAPGFELRADGSGRHSVRFVPVKKAA